VYDRLYGNKNSKPTSLNNGNSKERQLSNNQDGQEY